MTEHSGRVYGGRSEAERRADRRGRLVEAALELFGTEGWRAASIERLCAQAQVATRSFYEEFSGREALMRAVYDAVVASATAAVETALATTQGTLPERIAAGIGAYVQHVTEDPRRARVAYREVRAVGELEAHRHDVMVGFAQLVEDELHGRVFPQDPVRRRTVALALAGAMSEVLVDWVAHPAPRPPIEPLLDELVRLYTVALVPLHDADQDGVVHSTPEDAGGVARDA